MSSLSETCKAKEGNISQNPSICLWEALLDRRWQCRWVSLRQAQRRSSPLTSPRVRKSIAEKHWWQTTTVYFPCNKLWSKASITYLSNNTCNLFHTVCNGNRWITWLYLIGVIKRRHLGKHSRSHLSPRKPCLKTADWFLKKKKALVPPCRMQDVSVIEFTDGSCSVSEVNSASSWNPQKHQPMQWMQIVHLILVASQLKFALLLQLCCIESHTEETDFMVECRPCSTSFTRPCALEDEKNMEKTNFGAVSWGLVLKILKLLDCLCQGFLQHSRSVEKSSHLVSYTRSSQPETRTKVLAVY